MRQGRTWLVTSGLCIPGHVRRSIRERLLGKEKRGSGPWPCIMAVGGGRGEGGWGGGRAQEVGGGMGLCPSISRPSTRRHTEPRGWHYWARARALRLGHTHIIHVEPGANRVGFECVCVCVWWLGCPGRQRHGPGAKRERNLESLFAAIHAH